MGIPEGTTSSSCQWLLPRGNAVEERERERRNDCYVTPRTTPTRSSTFNVRIRLSQA